MKDWVQCSVVSRIEGRRAEEWMDGVWRCRVIDRNYTLERSNVLCWREVLLSDSIKKALADRQGRWSGE